MLIAFALIVLAGLYPQVDGQSPGKQGLGKWKPGPNVAQELARLEHDGRQLFRSFREGKIAQSRVMRELARVSATQESLRAWSFENHSDEVPELVVVVDPDEFLLVFPRGVKHLPGKLVAGQIYASTPGSSKQWQYLGQRQASGMRLAVFRYASSEATVSSQHQN